MADDVDWSSDDIPVPDAPPEPVWHRRAPEPDDEISMRPADPPTNAAITGGRSTGLGAKLLGVGAALLVVAIIVGLIVRSGDDTATPATTAPEVSTQATGPDTTIEQVDDTTVEREPSTPLEPIEVALPPAVAAIQQPTEIVMLTSDRAVQTLSLPSGRVRSVVVDDASGSNVDGYGSGEIVIAPDGAAIGMVGSSFVMLPRDGPPVSIDGDDFGPNNGINVVGWQPDADGSTLFSVVVYPQSSDQAQFFNVGLDGAVGALPTSSFNFSFGFWLTSPEGTRVVNDAGGAYEMGPDGSARRIEDGIVYATSADRRLLRSCDEAMSCALELVTVSTGERQVLDPAQLPDDFENMTYGISLSPDGGAATMMRTLNTQERVLVEFGVGETATAPTASWGQGSTWAADSSGFFDVAVDGGGLQFTDRESGETVTFGEEFGSITALGVRRPATELDAQTSVFATELAPARELDATGLTLAAAGRAGGVASVDVDAGLVTSWETADRLGAGDAQLIATADGVVALPENDLPAFLTQPGTATRLGDGLIADGPKFPGPIEGTIWLPVASEDAESESPTVGYQLLRLDGGVVEPPADWPGPIPLTINVTDDGTPGSGVLGSDGRGGLVVSQSGDLFTVAGGPASRLTSGQLLAINADTAYVRECDDAAICSIIRIDRSTGERTPTDIQGDLRADVHQRGPALASSVSPDGAVFLAQTTVVDAARASDITWVFVDTVTGALTPVNRLMPNQPVVWNADSTFAAALAGGDLVVFDRAAGEPVSLGASPMRAIGQAPAGWSAP